MSGISQLGFTVIDKEVDRLFRYTLEKNSVVTSEFQERPEREFSLSILTLIVAAMGPFLLLTTSARNSPAEENEVELLLKKCSEWDEESSCIHERRACCA